MTGGELHMIHDFTKHCTALTWILVLKPVQKNLKDKQAAQQIKSLIQTRNLQSGVLEQQRQKGGDC